ncbi:MAG: hypothetical protein ACJA1H_001807 [Glaciecola sp.]|jgi:hypothetical protein
MTISQDQIQALYAFVQKHYVEWHDVQTELVDHLANGIELQWQNDPTLTFDNALKLEFSKFGVMGFSEVIEEKTRALDRYYRKLVWTHVKDYFKLPKIIISFFLVYVLYFTLSSLENKLIITLPIAIVLVIIHFYHLYKSSKNIKLRQIETNKKWLFESSFLQLGGLIHFLNIGIYVPLIFNTNTQWSQTFVFVLSISIVIYFLVLFVAIKIVSPKLRQKFSEQHPEFIL